MHVYSLQFWREVVFSHLVLIISLHCKWHNDTESYHWHCNDRMRENNRKTVPVATKCHSLLQLEMAIGNLQPLCWLKMFNKQDWGSGIEVSSQVQKILCLPFLIEGWNWEKSKLKQRENKSEAKRHPEMAAESVWAQVLALLNYAYEKGNVV